MKKLFIFIERTNQPKIYTDTKNNTHVVIAVKKL